MISFQLGCIAIQLGCISVQLYLLIRTIKENRKVKFELGTSKMTSIVDLKGPH